LLRHPRPGLGQYRVLQGVRQTARQPDLGRRFHLPRRVADRAVARRTRAAAARVAPLARTSVIELILGALIAVAAVVIVALPFLRDNGEPELIDDPGSEKLLLLIEERDRALGALKDLEFDHRAGLIDDADYRTSVGQLRRDAAAALQALDAAKGSAEEDL